MTEPTSDPPSQVHMISAPDPDQAWRALSLVNEWIRHAEAKTGATLAATGVVGGLLYNLVKNQSHPSLAISIVASACATSALAAGIFCALALVPRIRVHGQAEDPSNLLFYAHIAKAFKDDAPSYVEVLKTLTTSPSELVEHIANQIHANATVAHRKFVWAGRALVALFLALVLLIALSVIVGSWS